MDKKIRDNFYLKIDFENDIELMKKQIVELERLKKIIINSAEYKVLDGKTQMIGTYDNDEYPDGAHSRGEHTECVANIAKTIISKIYERYGSEGEQKTEEYQLNKKIAELYAEIMGYSHDLGHTPFGHVGESGLNDFMRSIKDKSEIREIEKHRQILFGEEYEKAQGHSKNYDGVLSFEHNEQSAKVFYDIIKREKFDEKLIDVKRIIWGILGHSTSRVKIKEIPDDIVVQSIRAADKIEYINKDYEELRACLAEPRDLELAKFVREPYQQRVDKTIDNIVQEAFEYGRIDEKMKSFQILNELKSMGDECVLLVDVKKEKIQFENKKEKKQMLSDLYSMNYQYNFLVHENKHDNKKITIKGAKRGLVKDENVERLKIIAFKVAEYFYTHDEAIMNNDVMWKMRPINQGKTFTKVLGYQTLGAFPETKAEKVIKFVSSMDNARCESVYRKLVKDRILYGPDKGIEPINLMDINIKKMQQLLDAARTVSNDSYRHDVQETIGMVYETSKDYQKDSLNQRGRDEMEKNRKKHNAENQIDFFAYKLMINADSMRELGKSQEEISLAVLDELRKNKDKNWEEKKYEIVPYDGKVAKAARGEFENEK